MSAVALILLKGGCAVLIFAVAVVNYLNAQVSMGLEERTESRFFYLAALLCLGAGIFFLSAATSDFLRLPL